MITFPKKLYIIGTDTGVGKTLVSSILTLGLDGGYLKPIECGITPVTDTEWVQDITKLPKHHFHKEFYKFTDAHDPSSQHTNIEINELLAKQIPNEEKHLFIEGTEGVLSPIYADYFQVNYIQDLNIPTLLVIKNSKGAINQALLSLEKLKENGVEIFGIVINGEKDAILMESIRQYCSVPHIFELNNIEHITKSSLEKAFQDTFASITTNQNLMRAT